MKKSKINQLLAISVFAFTIFTGCAEGEENSGVTGLEELAVKLETEEAGGEEKEKNMGASGEAGGQASSAGEKEKNTETSGELGGQTTGGKEGEGQSAETGGDAGLPTDFASAKDFLAALPEEYEALKALSGEYPVYTILHGKEDGGKEHLKAFREKLEAETAGELLVVQVTVEGDAILDYYYYDGETLYRWEDISRDAFGGDGEKYFELIYDSAWFGGEADTEGQFYLSFYGLQEGDMVLELFRVMPLQGEKWEEWQKPRQPAEQGEEPMASFESSSEAEQSKQPAELPRPVDVPLVR